ncbi:MAG: hypothetical protein HQ546_09280, partial [Planctomycetes bacterium]|nr:hypothetical protein [Planctomycetota bacterium]
EIMSASVGTLTTLNNVQARVVATSTWHHAHGPMGKLVASATEKGFSLHKWNIWESIQNCPPDRHQNGRGCRQCLLQSPCLAKAKQLNARTQVGIASEGCGLFAIDDAIKQYRQWSTEQWEAEAECNRPTLTGLVYSQFDRRVHVRSDLDFCDELPVFRAIDWGLNDFVCLWIQQGKRGEVYVVDELCFRDTTTHQAARQIRQLDASVRVEATYCDPAGRNRNDQTGYSDIDVFRQHGIHCQYALSPWAREIRNGVSAIRAALRPAGGVPRLFVAGKCAQVINAFESYKLRQMNGEYVDEPIKPQPADHAMDALRYYFVNRHALFRAEARRMGYSG